MRCKFSQRLLSCAVVVAVLASSVLVPAVLWAAEREQTVALKKTSPATAEVEMFAGIESGDLAVKLIPRNEHEANVLFTNRTAKPLSVRLPAAFAGVPVAAQFRQRNNTTQNANQQSPQTTGNSFPSGNTQNRGNNPFGNNNNNNNNNFFNQRQGNGIFNIPAEKTIQIKIVSVCLEHGKPKPRAGIAYEIRPLDTVSDNPAVRELLVSLAAGKTSTSVAQAAAWHLANGLTWGQLTTKRIDHLSGPDEPYFTARQLSEAKALCADLEKTVQTAPSGASLSTQASTQPTPK